VQGVERHDSRYGGAILRNAPIAILLMAGLVAAQAYSYPLFHSLSELFSIVIATSIFVVAWNSRRLHADSYLVFLGIAFLFVAGLDLVHTLAYKGMGVFPNHDSDLPTQLWIAGRYMESLALLLAPLAIGRRWRPGTLFAAFATVFVLALLSIFVWRIFPACFVEGEGLTTFKRRSEYIICLILLGAAANLLWHREHLAGQVKTLLVAALAITVAQELSFTFYHDPYGVWNIAGHCLKIVAFYLVYKAIVETGLARPYNLLFFDLKRSEETLRHSEKRYRDLVELSPDAVFVNRNNQIVFVNAATLQLFGATRAEELLGKTPYDIFHPDGHAAIRERIASLQKGQPVPLVEERIVRLDGTVRDVEVAAGPFTDSEGIAIQVILRDATERKHMALKLQQAKEQAEAASRAKDHFLAVLSHELRTPLTPVLPALEAIAPQLSGEPAEFLEMARRNVALEARLIDDLLDVTRIARGKIQLDLKPVELSTIIRRAAEVCAPDIEARQLKFAVTTSDGPHFVNADAARLQQVFWNLLKNAVKFTPPGGSIQVREWGQDSRVTVAVTDSGVGIAPEALSRIFNAFEQEARANSHQFGGLGLGLAISKALVEMHGGAIRADSAGNGQGATLTVELPVMSPAPMAPPGQPDAHPAGSSNGVHLKVLLVEDHGDSAAILTRLLTRRGYQVQRAGDVATALSLAQAERFDLLISDLGLPDGSGYDVMRELVNSGRRPPAIALSGYGMAEDIHRSHEAGFDEHLTKPVDIQALWDAVDRVVAKAS
jgi:PAS domain S-box-containing protein